MLRSKCFGFNRLDDKSYGRVISMLGLLFFFVCDLRLFGLLWNGVGSNKWQSSGLGNERDGRLLLVQIQCSQLEIVDDARFTPIYAKKN